MATLGISTNTRLLGIAIVHEGRLVDYAMHLHKSSWSPKKATRIIASLEPCVRRYCIKKVVLSIPYAHHQTKAFNVLVSRICKYCKENGIEVCKTSPEALYVLCETGAKKTKKALMKSLTVLYPELHYSYHKELRNKNRYYIKLFEAVAVATLQEQKE